MSLRPLPEIRADASIQNARWEIRPDALERFVPHAADAGDPETITIYDQIGMDSWTGEGVTAKRIAGALRSIGERDIRVNINSPGGDFFEGVTIYNLLREHKAKVTVRVLGVAASAASVIAMAGDVIEIAMGSHIMVHNAWAVVMGNRHDLEQAMGALESFDESMAEIYAARTGIDRKKITNLMDAETWINADAAVSGGWADRKINEPEKPEGIEAKQTRTLAVAEAAFARAGMSRSERRALLKELTGSTPRAASDDAMPGAGELAAALARLQSTIAKGN